MKLDIMFFFQLIYMIYDKCTKNDIQCQEKLAKQQKVHQITCGDTFDCESPNYFFFCSFFECFLNLCVGVNEFCFVFRIEIDLYIQ